MNQEEYIKLFYQFLRNNDIFKSYILSFKDAIEHDWQISISDFLDRAHADHFISSAFRWCKEDKFLQNKRWANINDKWVEFLFNYENG